MEARDRWLERALLFALAGHVLSAAVARRYGFGADILLALAMLRVGWLTRPLTIVALAAAIAEAWEPRAAALAVLAWSGALFRARTGSYGLAVATLGIIALGASAPEALPFALPVWLGFAAEAVFRRARPFERYGRLARWRHPRALGRPLDAIANSRLLGVLLEPIPEATMRSDITDVVYVNYLVPAAEAARLVPAYLELQRLGPEGRYALFTFLTYRHGHFGFAFLGPLRRLMPSPIQTNWRIHVFDPRTKHRGIYFVTNAITHTLPALAARMTTEGMPMHVLRRADLRRRDGAITATLEPGAGSAPDAEITLEELPAPPALSGAWASLWPDFRSFLAYCIPQDRAMSSQPLRGRVSRQEIDLGIPLDACIPLAGTVRSRAAAALGADADPLCFLVPKVSFVFSDEAHDVIGNNQ